jgi:protein-disulfide isomerase
LMEKFANILSLTHTPMTKTTAFLFILVACLCAAAQKPGDIVATATGHTWTTKDLPPEAQDAIAKYPSLAAAARKQLLSQYVGELLLETEAKARAITPMALVKSEAKKIKDPTPAEIKAVYDANVDKVGGKTLAEVRPQIVEFLRHDLEEKAISAFVDTLAAKYRGAYPKDINAAGSLPTDVLFSMTGGAITVKEFDDQSRLTLYGIEADYFADLKAVTAEMVYNALVLDESKASNVDSGQLISREITSKMKDFSDEERNSLEAAFRNKLFAKYKVNLAIKEPVAPVQNISVDDDPSKGLPTAPVTIVMFSDFQCSACSATHPLLQQAMTPHADKLRFVVRDYPLETLHPNAFRAALAANAAKAQGKFFEYTDILYKNQKALDDASLKKYAADLGLNAAQFALDFNSEKTSAEVRKDMADGKSYGITGTPSIFINGRFVRDISLDGLKEAIENAFKK